MDKIDLTMEDIVLMIGLIKSAQQKGGFFEAEELLHVGTLYNKLLTIAKMVQEKIKANQVQKQAEPSGRLFTMPSTSAPSTAVPNTNASANPNPFFGSSFISN